MLSFTKAYYLLNKGSLSILNYFEPLSQELPQIENPKGGENIHYLVNVV